MFSIAEIGNICIFLAVAVIVFGFLGLRDTWPMVGALAFVGVVSLMLRR